MAFDKRFCINWGMNIRTAALKMDSDTMTSSPLDRLADYVAQDMQAVNQLIIERMQSGVPLIPQLAGYLIAAGGKRIRPLMTLAATRLFDNNTQRPYPLAAAVEFIHTATLLHDDVVDESDQRRGRASANVVFGNQSSVLVGDFLFSRAFQLMVEDGSLDVLRILSNASAVITEGEVLQLSVQHDLDTTLEQYLQVISAKTGVLFSAACEIGPVITNQSIDVQKQLHDYGHYLGLAFQIADDVLDYQADETDLGKTIGDDFREGKITAPIIYAWESAIPTEKDFWVRTFQNKDIRDGDLIEAQNLIRHHGADIRAKNLALEYAKKSADSLNFLPDSPLKSILQDLSLFVVSRTK